MMIMIIIMITIVMIIIVIYIYIYNDDDGNSNSNNVQLDAGFMTKTQPTIAAPGCQAVGKTVSRLSGDGGDGGDGDIQHTSRHGIRSL